MDHEIQVWQVNAACSNIGCHTNAGPAITHSAKSVVTLSLAQLTGESNNCEATVAEACRQVLHHFAGATEDDGVLSFVETQNVDDRVFTVVWCDLHCAIFNISVLFAVAYC